MTRNLITLIAVGSLSWVSFSGQSANAEDAKVAAKALNTTIGGTLFLNDSMLWDEKAADIAKRLGMPQESKTSRQSSFRAYPGSSSQFLGARPYSMALYGDGGKAIRLSLVYANKGDFFSARGGGEDHFDKKNVKSGDLRSFRKAMDADEKAITAALSGLLGKPETQSFGEGSARRTVERWDWNGHAFLLAEENNEYVTLQVEPLASADEGGKVERAKDSQVRERIRKNVQNRDNGDVVVGDIPMVDQGPKGYCVPATFERCMRYVDVPADMYLLAMAGDSELGGGTSMDSIVNAIQRDVRRKGRTVRTFGGRVKTSTVARYIDDGIPVIWALHSNAPFNKIANERTSARRKTQDWDEWAKQVKKEQRNTRDLSKDDSQGHVAIIIGYNKETKEIAFSDSWGNAYRERWVGEKEADAVSQSSFAVISP
ncbi:MAG: hypothetical protein ACI9R3_001007 [Verrucomicrobiales bacterium]|jgi:hypothetical protein